MAEEPKIKNVSFQEIFHSQNDIKDKFLSRLFGIFSEDIVRIWCNDSQSPYLDLGRPTIKIDDEKRGRTMDFTFQSRDNGKNFVGELKCELEYENYRYMTLTGYFGEIGHLFGMKTAGCPVKSATPIL